MRRETQLFQPIGRVKWIAEPFLRYAELANGTEKAHLTKHSLPGEQAFRARRQLYRIPRKPTSQKRGQNYFSLARFPRNH